MKNDRTPRTLAESQFHVGYPVAHRPAKLALTDLVYATLCVAACAAIGVILAWRG